MIEEGWDGTGRLLAGLLGDLGWGVVLVEYCESDQMIPCPTRGTLPTVIDWPRATVYLSRMACPGPRSRTAALARVLVLVLDSGIIPARPVAKARPEG